MTKRNLINAGLCTAMLASTVLLSASPGLAEGSAAPRGTYLQSCQNINYSGGVLSAQCQSSVGLKVSTLEPAFCAKSSDIANVDGSLGCIAMPGTWGKGGATPNGSYKASCSRVRVELTPKPILWANCQRPDSNGNATSGDKFYPDSSLNLDQCEIGKDIANLKGQLICAPRKGPPPIRVPK